MTAKKAKFVLTGSVVNHPDHPKGLNRGDILTLEVGDDSLPTSDLFRTRVQPLGRDLDEEGGSTGDAKAIIKDAKAQAKDIIKKAEEEAAAIVEKANADAAALMDAAKS
jgi:hypothetical protein